MNTPLWKPILIVAVLALCALSLFPLDRRLKPGLDLAGGTTLVYEVDLPPGTNADREIESVIDVLRRRVDPTGVRNLIWRRQGSNRIEIQMPLPPQETVRLRQSFLDARKDLLQHNISPRELEAALRIADKQQRADRLKALAGPVEDRQRVMNELADASDALETARGPYATAQTELRQAKAAVAKLPPDTPAQQRQEAEAHVAQIQEDLTAKTARFVQARSFYQAKEAEALSTNVEWAEVDQALSLPKEVTKTSQVTHPRADAIKKLLADHPGRKDQIEALLSQFDAYDKVRGLLDDPNDLKALLRGSGVLEFRIAARPGNVANLAEYRQQLQEKGPRAGAASPWRWFVIDKVENFAERPADRKALEADAQAYFAGRSEVGQVYGGQYYLLLGNDPSNSITQSQPDWKLDAAYPTSDQDALPAVGFQLNAAGGQLMGALTSTHLKEPMAIVLDGRVMSTPTIQATISGAGIITGGSGGFDQQELEYLVRTLKAGSLKARLSDQPVSEVTTGPQLGQDNLHHGMQAAVLSLILVAVFMAVYYFFGGLVADFALAANMIIILGVMALLEATFTLPGIAGMVLTIGMTVDANVLIFERIREELDRKVELKTAVRLGYEKALSTIVDANITTLITCLVLGYTATAEVKGFAVTLGIGICASMFTALFCTHVIFDLWIDFFNPKSLNMLPTVVAAVRRLLSPNVNWIGLRRVFYAGSLAFIVGGLALVFVRGADMLDIEFRSGTQVGLELGKAPQGGQKMLTLVDVRQRLDNASQWLEKEMTQRLSDAEPRLATATGDAKAQLDRRINDMRQTLADAPLLSGHRASVVTVGQTATEGKQIKATAFQIATLVTDSNAVSDAVKEAFSDVLDVQRTIGFKGVGDGLDAPPLTTAPVYMLTRQTLGDNIGRPDVRVDVAEYVGGVAIVLDDLSPAATPEDLNERISRMRLQPLYEGLSPRTFTVIGLDLASAAEAGADAAGAPLYRSAVVVTRDTETNYAENPNTFDEAGGLADTEWKVVRDALQRDTSLASVANFSSQVSGTMQRQAIAALVLSLLAVVFYIWVRFGSLRYGLAAIAALVHDVSITLGLVAVSGYLAGNVLGNMLGLDPFRIDLAMVAAVLTIVGYSLNDTIVVFDRIRENRGRLATATPPIINDSINQTISRTILTSGTTLLAVLILYIFGGKGVHGFAFAMLVGVFVGTYSSIAIASPLLLIGIKAGTGTGAGRHGDEKDATKPTGGPKRTPAHAAS